ncbi:hypothetical protein Efla_007202 [Eimeria flavescens]
MQSKKPLTAPGGRRQSPSSATDEPQDEKQGPASDGSARPGSQQPAAASVTSPGSPDSESNAPAEEEQLILEPELISGGEPPAAGEAVELGVLCGIEKSSQLSSSKVAEEESEYVMGRLQRRRVGRRGARGARPCNKKEQHGPRGRLTLR